MSDFVKQYLIAAEDAKAKAGQDMVLAIQKNLKKK
jgi:hypothetical protein